MTNPMACGRPVLKLRQRDIILIPFPFSDLMGSKVRPALVISQDDYNGSHLDAVVVALTSNVSLSQYKILVISQDLESGRLPVDSAIRVDKPFSVLQSKTLKIQARVTEAKFAEVRTAIAALVG